MRRIALLASLVLLVVTIAAPALAVKPDPVSGHKIQICHATASFSHPFVKITIDLAAWNEPDTNGHGDGNHVRTKGGEVWSDKLALLDSDEPCPTAAEI